MTDLQENEHLAKALSLAADKHSGQFCIDGEPYFMHCMRVAMKMPTTTTKIIAVLHDLIEDTDYTLEDLRRDGYSETVINAVDALTHRAKEYYRDYIKRVKLNALAVQVKLADLEDNINALRLPHFGRYEEKRVGKYWRAYQELIK